MNTDHPEVPWITRQQIENRDRFPIDQLRPYIGKYVAWNWEQTQILDSNEDWGRLWDRLAENGHDPQRCPVEYIGD
jgi:hypothetical protein